MRILHRIEKLDFSVMNCAEEKFNAMAQELILTKRKNNDILAKYVSISAWI
jgi:hypothetical protein